MPLVYDGQESGLDKRLEFFQKDPIEWKNYEHAPFYAKLLRLKHENPALWNGQYGADVQVIETGNDKVFAFQRKQGSSVVSVVVNLSGGPQDFTLPGQKRAQLPAWEYQLDARK
jgi:glycosidase